MNATSWLAEDVSKEFEGAELGDPRRLRRLKQIAARVGADPTASFPDVFETSAEQEGFYRFIRNDSFDSDDILEPHVEATFRRAEHLGECLVLHDTTEFSFTGEREDLGPTSSTAQGFMAHVSLLVGLDEARTPLGVSALEQYVRQGRKGPRLVRERLKDETSEGHRWLRAARAIEERSAGRFDGIHVADREGDNYPFLHGMLELGCRFVVRISQDRRVLDANDETSPLHETVLSLPVRSRYDIPVSFRGKRLNPTQARSHPSRNERTATVSIAATSVRVPAPLQRRESTEIELNLVRVWEENPPSGQPAVEWLLWTTEPVDTVTRMRRVVDIYRTRWVIEEYFKALKTGCQFERRQLASFRTLTTALAIFLPVAWKLLLARSVTRAQPEAPPTQILTRLQVTYLEKKYRQSLRTARDALYAMARLGGHLRQNGEPGWLTLGRGYEKLVTGEAFYRVLTQSQTSDQS